MSKQLSFDFVKEIDKELAAKAEADRLYWKRANQDAHLRWMSQDMPPENEEWDVILMGIRLDRHVHDSECERCNLGTYNHCPPHLPMHWSDRYNQYCPTKVCLKDFLKKCKEWNIKLNYLGGPPVKLVKGASADQQ